MKNPFQPLLEQHGIVIFDGALATELERRGADLSSHLWSARLITDDPSAIVAVHLDHLRAGADVISSASYQASRLGFVKAGRTERDADAMITRAVELAHEAVREHGSPTLVAASLGPYGAVLADGSEFTGDYALSVDELMNFHRPRLEAALAAKPDLVLFETLPSLAECDAVAALASQFSGVAFMASFSAKGNGLSRGEPFADAVHRLERLPNVIAAGVNCAAPDVVERVLSTVSSSRLALSASPNAGEQWDAQRRTWVGAASDGPSFSEWAKRFVTRGARIVGGCCRTRPADIAALRAQFPRRPSSQAS